MGSLSIINKLAEVDKLDIARRYFLCGSMAQVGRELGVRYDDLLQLAKEEWFTEELRALEREANALLKVKLTCLMDKTLSAIEDRLEHGDTIMADGRMVKIPIIARDLANLAKIVFEKKRELADMEVGFASPEANRLAALAASLKAKEVYDGEIVERS